MFTGSPADFATLSLPQTTRRYARLLVLAIAPTIPVFGQPAPEHFASIRYELDSAHFSGDPDGLTLRDEQIISEPGSRWIALKFGPTHLGRASRLMIRSLEDGDEQTFTQFYMEEWQGISGRFRGDSVEVSLWVDSADADVFWSLREIIVGNPEPPAGIVYAPERTQCGGTDDRVAHNDPAIGRITPAGCTGWIVANAAYLSAGHCIPGNGMTWLEFNVPASNANGSTNPPAMRDQYPIRGVAGANNGVGNDYAVFDCGRNTVTGRFPWQQQQAYYRLTTSLGHTQFDLPPTLRVTGYGIDFRPPGTRMPPATTPCCRRIPPVTGVCTFDCNAQSATQQTHTGPLSGWRRPIFGLNTDRINHQVDTEGGNSGSPVIFEQAAIPAVNGYALAIHTAGGCGLGLGGFFIGENAATGFLQPGLRPLIHLHNSAGGVYYVDNGHFDCDNLLIDFDMYDPACKAVAGINEIAANAPGAKLRIIAGEYRENFPLINTSMTLQAPVGGVLLGRPQ